MVQVTNPDSDPANLQPGDYFKNHKVWYRAVTAATVLDGDYWTITAWDPREGRKCTHKLWGKVEERRVRPPDVFRPSALARKASKVLAESEVLRDKAARLHAMARELDQEQSREGS